LKEEQKRLEELDRKYEEELEAKMRVYDNEIVPSMHALGEV